MLGAAAQFVVTMHNLASSTSALGHEGAALRLVARRASGIVPLPAYWYALMTRPSKVRFTVARSVSLTFNIAASS
jgi:hypothetical protein